MQVLPKEFKGTKQRKYDLADQTLTLCAYRDDSIVLTDDGGLLMELEELKLSGFLLPTFSLLMVAEGLLKKNSFAKMIKFWKKIGPTVIKI